MKKKKKLTCKLLLSSVLLGFNVSCTTFNTYEQDRQQGKVEYVHKIPQQDRDAYEQERQRNKDEQEAPRQLDTDVNVPERQRNKDENEQSSQRDRTVYENSSEEFEVEVEEDLFPITRDMIRENRGSPIDRSSFMITLSPSLPFSLFTDSVTATSKVSSGEHKHKRRIRRHAATWNNPNSMIAKSSKAEN